MEILPVGTVRDIAKNAAQKLDPNAKMSANASLLLNKASTMFIHYLAATANEFTLAKGKSTIGCTEIFEAINEMGFHNLTQGCDELLKG